MYGLYPFQMKPLLMIDSPITKLVKDYPVGKGTATAHQREQKGFWPVHSSLSVGHLPLLENLPLPVPP